MNWVGCPTALEAGLIFTVAHSDDPSKKTTTIICSLTGGDCGVSPLCRRRRVAKTACNRSASVNRLKNKDGSHQSGLEIHLPPYLISLMIDNEFMRDHCQVQFFRMPDDGDR